MEEEAGCVIDEQRLEQKVYSACHWGSYTIGMMSFVMQVWVAVMASAA